MKSLHRRKNNYDAAFETWTESCDASFFKYGQPRAQSARFNGLCPTASPVHLKCLIHASTHLTDSIPGETATTAVTLIELEGMGDGEDWGGGGFSGNKNDN